MKDVKGIDDSLRCAKYSGISMKLGPVNGFFHKAGALCGSKKQRTKARARDVCFWVVDKVT